MGHDKTARHGWRLCASDLGRKLADVDDAAVLITPAVGVGGLLLGALLARRNDRRSRTDELLAEASNDAVRAIAHVASSNSTDAQAQTDYASAVSRWQCMADH